MIFESITPAWLAAIESNAQKQLGLVISGNEGTASKDGITIEWSWNPADLTLTVGDTKKPWYDPEGVIESKLTALVQSSKPNLSTT